MIFRLIKFSFGWPAFAALLGTIIFASSAGLYAQSSPDQSVALEQLGNQLFSSPVLSENETRSCATCHVPELGFSGDEPVATTLSGERERRRAPSLYGVTAAKSLMWDGRASDLEHQVLLPLEGAELRVDWPKALNRLNLDPEITRLAREAEKPLNRDTIVAAIVAYVRSLDRSQSRFDRYFRGSTYELSDQEQRGFRIFQRKARCSSCHLIDSRGAPFTDGVFHVTAAGLESGARDDRGRAETTGDPLDVGAFKTPSLRGASLRPFLLHNGRMRSLRELIEYYNTIDPKALPGIDSRLAPLHLTTNEIDDLVAFLGALTPLQKAKL